MKATFFCFREPKCFGQVYYCADCCDKHEHKSIVISKKIKELSNEWNDTVSEVIASEKKASDRYNAYRKVIEYCEEVNK